MLTNGSFELVILNLEYGTMLLAALSVGQMCMMQKLIL